MFFQQKKEEDGNTQKNKSNNTKGST